MDNIMDKINKKAAETYNAAAKTTGKIAKEIKLKAQMSENKDKIQEYYEDIGKIVYEKYVLKEEINIEKSLLDNCSMIDVLANENEELRKELLKLKDLKQCPKCHTEIDSEFEYCPKCGSRQEISKETNEQKYTNNEAVELGKEVFEEKYSENTAVEQ